MRLRSFVRISVGLAIAACCGRFSLGAAPDIDYENAHKEKKARAVRTTAPVVLDGELSEPEWKLAQPVTDFVQLEPKMGGQPTERTEVRLLYDSENLYFGVTCFQAGGRRALVISDVSHDYASFETDAFTFLLDTFDDNRNGFLFGVNPGGGRKESQISANGANINVDWNTIWYAKSKITEEGWQAEIAIPFKSLRFRDAERQVWGVNFSRRIRRKNEEDPWSPLPRPLRLDHVSLAGPLEGIEGIHQGRNLYFKPYVTAPLTRRQNDDVDFLPDAGLDVKYGVTPGLTLDLTVNTDFAQVEADEEQVNLTRFSLFFPEKREFFLENAGNFQLGRARRGAAISGQRDLIPFFSRRLGISGGRVVPIFGGARLSGRVGSYTLGLLSMQADKFETTPSTNVSVARIRRDILQGSDLGGIFIDKQESGGRFNRTYGVDADFTFFRNLDISSFLLKTDTSGIRKKNMAANFALAWKDPRSEFQVEHLTIQNNFNPEAGFVPRKGLRKTAGAFTWTPRPGKRIPWIREFRPAVTLDYITNQENSLDTRTLSNSLSVVFQNGGILAFARDASFERLRQPFRIQTNRSIPVGDYQFEEYSASFSSDKSRMFSGSIDVSTGSFYDGDRNSYVTGLLFQSGYHLKAQVSWNYNDVALPSGSFSTNLLVSRLRYTFTPDMFLNALIQYNSTLREISSNIRFNFTYKPLSDLFLVYNERRARTGGVIERALIAKMTYVFNF